LKGAWPNHDAIVENQKMICASGIIALNTKEKLLLATRKCLLEKGHAATTIKEIAKEAGVNHGLVHHYFGSKENLFVSILLQEKEIYDKKLQTIEDEESLIDFLVETLFQNSRLHAEFNAMAQQMPLIKKTLKEILDQRKDEILHSLDVQDEAIALLILDAVGGLALHSSIDKSLPVKEILLKLFRTFTDERIKAILLNPIKIKNTHSSEHPGIRHE